MLIIEDKLVADDVVMEEFICNLSACKGACCWEGDFGAPLEETELATLDRIYHSIAPFLLPEGREAIENQAPYVSDPQGGYATPLVNHGPCAYMTRDALGIAQCGIEQAWKAGATDFQKPISCHLYPIRVLREVNFEALNYHRWKICSPACELGKQHKVKVYQFVKGAIVRKYGQEFFDALDDAAKHLQWRHGRT